MATKKAAAAPAAAPKKQKTAAAVSKPKVAKQAAPEVQQIDDGGVKIKRKATIHHNYREINVEMTDGTVFQTYSTYPNNVLRLDVDIKTHPAWTKDANYVNTKASAVAKFNSKFQGLSFMSKKAEA